MPRLCNTCSCNRCFGKIEIGFGAETCDPVTGAVIANTTPIWLRTARSVQVGYSDEQTFKSPTTSNIETAGIAGSNNKKATITAQGFGDINTLPLPILMMLSDYTPTDNGDGTWTHCMAPVHLTSDNAACPCTFSIYWRDCKCDFAVTEAVATALNFQILDDGTLDWTVVLDANLPEENPATFPTPVFLDEREMTQNDTKLCAIITDTPEEFDITTFDCTADNPNCVCLRGFSWDYNRNITEESCLWDIDNVERTIVSQNMTGSFDQAYEGCEGLYQKWKNDEEFSLNLVFCDKTGTVTQPLFWQTIPRLTVAPGGFQTDFPTDGLATQTIQWQSHLNEDIGYNTQICITNELADTNYLP